MVEAIQGEFARVFSIELEPTLSRRAAERFQALSHVTIVEGDSSKALFDVLKGLDERCLLWLDGHFSGGVTARGNVETGRPRRGKIS
jgi:hypothetical protein